jgi:hypothetical protein
MAKAKATKSKKPRARTRVTRVTQFEIARLEALKDNLKVAKSDLAELTEEIKNRLRKSNKVEPGPFSIVLQQDSRQVRLKFKAELEKVIGVDGVKELQAEAGTQIVERLVTSKLGGK